MFESKWFRKTSPFPKKCYLRGNNSYFVDFFLKKQKNIKKYIAISLLI